MRKILFFAFTILSLPAWSNFIVPHDTISGYAYIDLNNNGTWDPGEPALANQPITISPTLNTTITDSNGFYSFLGDSAVFETIKPDSLQYAAFAPGSFNILLPGASTDTGNLNFGFHYVDTFSDVGVFATEVIRAIPGAGVEYRLTLNNHGARAETGTLIFIFDSHFTYNSSLPAAALAGDTLKWNFSNMPIGSYLNYTITMATNSNAAVGSVFNDTAYVSIVDSDAFPANNLEVITDTIVSAYQRNNKTVTPQNYTGADFQAGDYLDFNITFQNTDTVTVGHVWIIDTLTEYLDMTTLNVVAASAPYQLTINGNALRADFYNINLPDSAVNQDGSHGFFRFRIRPEAGFIFGNIYNIAYIYLDGKCDTGHTECNVCITHLDIGYSSSPETFYSCFSPTLGLAEVVVTNSQDYPGQASCNFVWSNASLGSISGSFSSQINAEYGEYYVTVTDFCGTTAIGMVYVDSVWNPRIVDSAIEIFVPTCANETNGVAAIATCGGLGPYSYHWSNGQATDTVSNLSPYVIYYCTVTDSIGNSAVVTVELPSKDDAQSFGSGLQYYNCDYTNDNLGYAQVAPSGGSPPYTVMWSTNTMGDSIYSLNSGIYSVTVTDSFGCNFIDTFDITTIYDIQFNSLYALQYCANDRTMTLVYDVSGVIELDINAAGPTIRLYSSGYPQPGEISGSIVVPLYTYISVSAINSLNDYCSYDSIVNDNQVWQDPYSEAYIISNPKCLGDSTGVLGVDWYGNNYGFPMTIQWSNGFTEQLWTSDQETVYNLSSGMYSVTMTDPIGCTVSLSITLNASDSLSIAAIIQNSICNAHGSIQLTVSGGVPGYTYNWNNGEASATDSLLPPGSYICTVSDGNNCSLQVSYNVGSSIDNLTAGLQAQNCDWNNQFTNLGVASVSPQQGYGPYNVEWSTGATDTEVDNLPSGNYTVIVTDSVGCTVVDSFTITLMQWQELNWGAPACTYADSIILYYNVLGATEIAIDFVTGGYIPNYPNSEINLPPGNSQMMFATNISQDGDNCLIDTFLNEPYPVGITASIYNPYPGANCADTSHTLSVMITQDYGEEYYGYTPNYTYHWSTGLTTDTINDLPIGIYTCTVTSNGCTVVSSDTITQPPPIEVIPDLFPPTCFDYSNGSIALMVSGGAGAYSYHWTSNAADSIDSNLTAGTYGYTITDAHGCAVSDSATLSQPDSISVLFSYQAPACGAATGSLTLDSVYGGTPTLYFAVEQ